MGNPLQCTMIAHSALSRGSDERDALMARRFWTRRKATVAGN